MACDHLDTSHTAWELLLLGTTIAIRNPSSIPEVSTDDHMHQIPSERSFKLEAICVRTAKSYMQLSKGTRNSFIDFIHIRHRWPSWTFTNSSLHPLTSSRDNRLWMTSLPPPATPETAKRLAAPKYLALRLHRRWPLHCRWWHPHQVAAPLKNKRERNWPKISKYSINFVKKM